MSMLTHIEDEIEELSLNELETVKNIVIRTIAKKKGLSEKKTTS